MGEGDTVGRYRLGPALGSGGMGTVYRAHDPELDRDVALKVIPLQHDATGARVRRRVAREAQALGAITHPHVVEVYDAGVTDDALYISMELVEGGDLAAWLRRDKRSVDEIVAVFTAAGEGLAAAHTRGLIHRDFKPGNVLVGRDDRVRVVDFGLARLMSDEASDEVSGVDPPIDEATIAAALTVPGSVLGTPSYMSPEQHACMPLDARTDQYSFCVALHEAIHQRRPFGGSAKAMAKAKLAYRGTDDAKHTTLQAIIDRGLAPRRADRFESMQALLQALAELPAKTGRGLWILGGIGVAALCAQLGVMLFVGPEVAATCSGEGQLESVWNPAHAHALRLSFVASGHFAGAEYAGHVIDQLGNYTGRWHRAYDEACAAGAPTESVRACLDDAKTQLQRHVERYTDPSVDHATLLRAPTELARAPAPEACVHEARLQPDAAVDSADARQLIGELRALTAVPESPRDAAQVRIRVDEILAHARAHGLRAVQAEGAFALAAAHAWAGELDAASAAAERAYIGAAAAGNDRLELEAAARCAALAAQLQRDADRDRWFGRAEALVDRLDARGTRLHAKVLSELGVAAHNRGQIVEAERFYAEAYAIAQAFPEETQTLIDAGVRYGQTLAAVHKYAEAEPYFAEAFALASDLLGPQSIPAGDALTGSCSVLDALGQHEDAAAACRRALAVIVRFRGADSSTAIQTRLRLAQALRNAAEYGEAIEVARAAVRLADPQGDGPTLLKGQAHLFLGTMLHGASRYDEAIEELTRAEQLLAASIGRHNGVFTEALTALGLAQFDSGDAEGAEATLRRALASLQDRPTSAYERVGTRVDLARVLLQQGRPRDALTELEQVRGEIPNVSAAEIRGDGLLLLARTLMRVHGRRSRDDASELARAAATAYEEAGGRFLQYATTAREFADEPSSAKPGPSAAPE